MSRPLRPTLPLLVALLSAACAGRETARPPAPAESLLSGRRFQSAIRLAQPFPPIPASVGRDVIPITFNFDYVLRPRR